MANQWTAEEVRKALEILPRHKMLINALPELSSALNRPVTKHAVRHAFIRFDLKSPSQYLGKSSAPASVAVPQEPVREEIYQEHLRSREAKSTRSRETELLEMLHESRERQKFLDEFSAPTRPLKIHRRETTSGLREGTAVVLASDWHIEEVVDPMKIAGRNAYNLDIAQARATRFFQGVEWLANFARNEFTLREIVLWLGGDLMSGHIHEELMETNELSPAETILKLRDMLVGGIDYLLEDPKLECLKIPCSFGNHGRTTQKFRSKTGAENSFEWLLYNVLAWHYEKEPRVQFAVDKSRHQYVEAYDFRLHFHHGDTVRFWGGVGGLSIPLNKRIPKWDNVLRSDYHHIGHFHQAIDLGRVLVNGSLIGYNEYAMDQGCDFEPPQQMFYVLDSKRGKCLPTPIWVDEEAGFGSDPEVL